VPLCRLWGKHMPKPAADKLRDKLRKLHAMLGSDKQNERENAHAKIEALLAKHKKTWNDLLDLINSAAGDVPDTDVARDAPLAPPPLELIYHFLQRYVQLDEHQLVAVTLWIAHTFVFGRFSITPRLVLYSPVRGCGKTTLLDVIAALGFKTERIDNITAAVLFRLIDRSHFAVLIDEADNADLPNDKTLLAVTNSGHRRGGKVSRFLGGEVVKFSTFAPLAFATIHRLPLPLLHRSVVIRMTRSSVNLMRFDPHTFAGQQSDCDIIYRQAFDWTATCPMNLDPPLPDELRNRAADNWRVLIGIADACSQEWGRLAREAAIALSSDQEEDLGVMLLEDIRDIFDRRPMDRLPSAVIVAELNAMPDAPWAEWRGQRDDQAPRPLSQAQLAGVLSPFNIKPRTIWPTHRGVATKSSKGYLKSDFERAWESYCDGTAAQRSNISFLSPRKSQEA
jgi:hypothetical protein